MDPKGRDLLIFKSSAVGGWEPGGGDLGELTCGKRWGLLSELVSVRLNSLRSTASLEPKGSVAGTILKRKLIGIVRISGSGPAPGKGGERSRR